jgi:AcrR family transcriptional regulator
MSEQAVRQSIGSAETRRPGRRRGAELESALLQAAWDELELVGYSSFTMEAVAARAGTSKPVIYRRWPNRAQLVLAALRQQVPSITEQVPDCGDLRIDALTLLGHLRSRQQIAGVEVLHGLLAELRDVPRDIFGVVPNVMMQVLARAQERGEVQPERVTARVAALPGVLLRHEMMVSRGPITDEFLTEVVDEVFLPLVATSSYLRAVQDQRDH